MPARHRRRALSHARARGVATIATTGNQIETATAARIARLATATDGHLVLYVAMTSMAPTMASLNAPSSSAGIQYSWWTAAPATCTS